MKREVEQAWQEGSEVIETCYSQGILPLERSVLFAYALSLSVPLYVAGCSCGGGRVLKETASILLEKDASNSNPKGEGILRETSIIRDRNGVQ